MNFKKIIAAVAAGALAISLFSFSASAEATTLRGSIQDAEVGWLTVSEDIEIDGEGSYSITVTPDTAYTKWGRFVFEPVMGAVAPAEYTNATVTFDSIVVNGDTELPLGTAVYPLCDDQGKININLLNVWYVPELGYVLDTSESAAIFNDATDCTFIDADGNPIAISSWTVNFTIGGGAGAASPATGNAPVIAIGAVMALAVVGAVISRKRK